jgi:hypothetical protein
MDSDQRWMTQSGAARYFAGESSYRTPKQPSKNSDFGFWVAQRFIAAVNAIE